MAVMHAVFMELCCCGGFGEGGIGGEKRERGTWGRVMFYLRIFRRLVFAIWIQRNYFNRKLDIL